MDKKVFQLLMIGNSSCQFYTDELYGMADAAGAEMRVCNVYAGACTLVQHATWLKTGEKNYEFQCFDANGRSKLTGVGLDDCLAQGDWDVISYQDGERYYRNGGLECARENTEPYMGELYEYVQGRFPAAKHYFHQVWAYQVGYARPGNNPFTVPDSAVQQRMHDDLRSIALEVCGRYGMPRVPVGDAWQLARADARVGDILCMPDCVHDGEDGGQYLNACVWMETLLGISCVGNTFRPEYNLPEERIAALQQAAHTAVAAAYGPDHAK